MDYQDLVQEALENEEGDAAGSKVSPDHQYGNASVNGEVEDRKVTILGSLTPDTSRSRQKWPQEHVAALIEHRRQVQHQFAVSKRTQKLWRAIISRVKTILPDFNYTAAECSDKWRSLHNTYRQNRCRVARVGPEGVGWQWYEMMDSVYGKEASSDWRRSVGQNADGQPDGDHSRLLREERAAAAGGFSPPRRGREDDDSPTPSPSVWSSDTSSSLGLPRTHVRRRSRRDRRNDGKLIAKALSRCMKLVMEENRAYHQDMIEVLRALSNNFAIVCQHIMAQE